MKFYGTHRYINLDKNVCVFGDYAYLKKHSRELFNEDRETVRRLKHSPEQVINGWIHLGVVNQDRKAHVNVN